MIETRNDLSELPVIDSGYWGNLNNEYTSIITYENQGVGVGRPYTSALGFKCRTLTFSKSTSTNKVAKRVACRQGGSDEEASWHMVNTLITNQ
ncbi:hypothetical protein [Vibrio sp. HN007]|uniref:hypothetical protein n=1 Tax=Vibrio iocasae TaxID=3098914 RepID=UPI0035D47AF2